MNISIFFDTVKVSNCSELMDKEKKLIDSYIIRLHDYQIGNLVYEIPTECIYFTYIYVANNNYCRSNLLQKKFNDKSQCIKYSQKLRQLCDSGKLDNIVKLINHVK